jgi:hypothetical protein
MNIEVELGLRFDELQIESLDFNYDKSSLILIAGYERGGITVTLTFQNVRRYLVEMPPFEVDAPFLIFHSTFETLNGDGSEFLTKNNYGHLDRNGDVYAFESGEGKLYRLTLHGDINLDIVFEKYSLIKDIE